MGTSGLTNWWKSSTGILYVNVQTSLSAVLIFIIFHKFSESFRFIVQNKEYNLKIMVGAVFFTPYRGFKGLKMITLSQFKKLTYKSCLALYNGWHSLKLSSLWKMNENILQYES